MEEHLPEHWSEWLNGLRLSYSAENETILTGPDQASADNLPPEAVHVALDIAKIPDSCTRKQVSEAVRVLLKKCFT